MDTELRCNNRDATIARVKAALTTMPEPERMPSLRELVHLSRQAIDMQRRDGRQWQEIAASFVAGGYPEAKATTVARYHKEQLSRRVASEQKRKLRTATKPRQLQNFMTEDVRQELEIPSEIAMTDEGLETGGASIARRLK